MNNRCIVILFLIFTVNLVLVAKDKKENTELIYLDDTGIIRWKSDGREVALFGANYNLPYACDYRAAGYITSDRKKLIDQDMTHFARMGWDGLRLCMWGDWQSTDKKGNLIENDHLDLIDYLILKASERKIYMLLTPITTYSALWPDAMGDTASVHGFSKYYSRAELGTNPDAIAAQVNYIQQLLEHVNPYTGMAIKDDPNILFIEMINEPYHHPEDFDKAVGYINALVDAVKSTGCEKILFHNLTQDMRIAPAIKASKVDGVSFAWYPAGLVFGKAHRANLLRTVDDFTPMHTKEIDGLPRIVYEFDEADSYTPYMYPAMTRTFRSVGAQFVVMFSYDMLATAPYNLGWQTHLMNMIYYPQKAVGAIIASEEMEILPMWKDYGAYPENTHFGPVRISYQENQAELITEKKFYYANNTTSFPPDSKKLEKIVGFGSSPVIDYEGYGIYFLDKINKTTWRLEVYPDAKIVSEPFAQMSPGKAVSRLVYREWTMTIKLPAFEKKLNVFPVNEGNTFYPKVENQSFLIYPGVYVLTTSEDISKIDLPEKMDQLGFTEFVSPEPMQRPADVVPLVNKEYLAGKAVKISAEIISETPADEVLLYLGNKIYKRRLYKIPMQAESGYRYSATIPSSNSKPGIYNYCIVLSENNTARTYPSGTSKTPDDWDFVGNNLWEFTIVEPKTPLILLDPENDMEDFAFTRIGDGIRWGIYDIVKDDMRGNPALRLYYPVSYDETLDDYTISLIIKQKIENRKGEMNSASDLRIEARSETDGQEVFVTLMEADGTSWSSKITLNAEWDVYNIPLEEFKISKGVKLPLGFPERWNYWVEPASGRGGVNDNMQMDKTERLQISLRSAPGKEKGADSWIEISTISLLFK